MNKREFNVAFALAKDFKIDLSNESVEHLEGYGTRGFKSVVATPRQMARLMRWQALNMDGSWNMGELNMIRHFFKKRVQVIV